VHRSAVIPFIEDVSLAEQDLSQEVLPHFGQVSFEFSIVLLFFDVGFVEHEGLQLFVLLSLPQHFFTASHDVRVAEAIISPIADAFKIDFVIVLFDL